MISLERELRQLAQKFKPGSREMQVVIKAGGAALKAAVAQHYSENSATGFRKAHVSKGQVRTVTHASGAAVQIDSKELAHLIIGGVVRPKAPRKALAIPLTPEARAAGNPGNNRIPGVFRPKGTRVLARKSGAGIEALWALVAAVTHKPHPEMEPTTGLLDSAVRSEVDYTMARVMR